VVISAIGGSAGVGKTALAVYWAHRVADRKLHDLDRTTPEGEEDDRTV
jgi:2-phosphoglycerate kinase